MKKIFKGASLALCSMMLLAGCSKGGNPDTTANIKNPDDAILSGLKEETKSITLEKLYDELKSQTGNATAANQLLEIVGDLILADTTWKSRYDAKVEEKLMELVKELILKNLEISDKMVKLQSL